MCEVPSPARCLLNIMIRRKVKVNNIEKGKSMKKKEFYDLADRMEEECGDWENSEGLSEKSMSELISKVEAMAAEEAEEKKKPPVGKKRFHLKKRYVIVLAAALALVMGMGVIGDRAWITDGNDLERESELTTKVNNEDKKSVLKEEEEVYQEIGEKLGIVPMWFGYVPDGMVLDSYTIMESTGWANMYYLYHDNVIHVQMAKDDAEISSNVQWDGQYRKLDNVENAYGYEIEAYCIDEENHNYGATLSYGNGYYDIFGVFPSEEEFFEILNWIHFKSV